MINRMKTIEAELLYDNVSDEDLMAKWSLSWSASDDDIDAAIACLGDVIELQDDDETYDDYIIIGLAERLRVSRDRLVERDE